jgi:hypothetical protein
MYHNTRFDSVWCVMGVEEEFEEEEVEEEELDILL